MLVPNVKDLYLNLTKKASVWEVFFSWNGRYTSSFYFWWVTWTKEENKSAPFREGAKNGHAWLMQCEDSVNLIYFTLLLNRVVWVGSCPCLSLVSLMLPYVNSESIKHFLSYFKFEFPSQYDLFCRFTHESFLHSNSPFNFNPQPSLSPSANF